MMPMNQTDNYRREDTEFHSHGTRCAAWLYRPATTGDPPVIIMAHGFAGERCFGLPDFATRFVAHGWAVLLFDYRTFGASDGAPRNDVNPAKHNEDWDAAIVHARGIPDIDTTRIVLWGSSFSGGHVVCAAGRHADIAAIIAQVPYTGLSRNTDRPPPLQLLRILFSVLYDRMKTALTGKPYYIPAIGRPGTFAVMNTPESFDGYMALIPPDREFANRVPAKCLGMMAAYDPTSLAHRVACPALVIGGADDSLIPIEWVEAMTERMPRAVFERLACNHFAPYKGAMFEQNIALQIAFLEDLFGVQ